jgi:transcriptional regulator with XRE-family HTH domain
VKARIWTRFSQLKPPIDIPYNYPTISVVTLLAPFKHITSFKLSKLSVFSGTESLLENFRTKTPEDESIEPVLAAPLPPTPTEILQDIGNNLRQLREHKQMSREDVSARTQIQPRLIQAIEEGHIEMLPESVFVKGMVKRYGDSLGLDGRTIAARVPKWEPEVATFEPITKLQTTGFSAPIRVSPTRLYFGYTLAIVGLGARASYLIDNATKPPALPTFVPTAQPRPAAKPAQPSLGVGIEIVVQRPTWAQIGIDGTTKFTGNLKAGTQLNWVATKQITINTNNAGGLVISRGKQPPQPLGKIGQKQSVTIKVSK